MSHESFIENLCQAVMIKDIKKIRKLHTKHPDLLDHPDSRVLKCYLLNEATIGQNKEIIEFLVELPSFDCGDNVNLEEELALAISKGNVRLAEFFLLNGAKLDGREWMDTQEPPYSNIFRRANLNTRKDMLKLLVNHGLDTGIRYENGMNILHQFIRYFVCKGDKDTVEIAEILLNSGISVNDTDDTDNSTIFYAVCVQIIELVSFFIDKGADVNKKIKDGSFPLQVAITYDNEDIVDLLLSSGADVNVKNQDGQTALHTACSFPNDRIISSLLRQGADVNAKNCHGESPLGVLKSKQGKYVYDKCLMVMIKEFSKLALENIPLSKCDTDFIVTNPKAREHFKKCSDELKLMKGTIFHGSHTYYCVLKMATKNLNIEKIANLMSNKKIVKDFKENISKFFYYQRDFRQIFKDAVKVRDNLIAVQSRSYSIFNNFLPDVVLGKIARNLNSNDLLLTTCRSL